MILLRTTEIGSKYDFYKFRCAPGGWSAKPIAFCQVPLARKPQQDHVWAWDGKEPVTILPSIHCSKCGRHFNVVKGVEVDTPDAKKALP